MNYQEVKMYVKKDEAKTYYTLLKRKIGLLLTWLILKIFPSISANFVTLSMIPLNMLAAGILYFAIVSSSIPFLFAAFSISFFTLALDSVDGNIARIKKTTSIKGVFLDRLVHNVSHPIFFFVLGFALYGNSHEILYLIIFIFVGILSELSPLDVSMKDVETLFVRQAVHHATLNYDYLTHLIRDHSMETPINQFKKSKIAKIIKSIFWNDVYYFMIIFDFLLFEYQFYLTGLFALADIIGMIIEKSTIRKWEINLGETLKSLNSQRNPTK